MYTKNAEKGLCDGSREPPMDVFQVPFIFTRVHLLFLSSRRSYHSLPIENISKGKKYVSLKGWLFGNRSFLSTNVSETYLHDDDVARERMIYNFFK